MIILGIILAVAGWVIGLYLLLWLGVIILAVGLVLMLCGAIGHPVGGRRSYW
jgi:hypothetical protein